jgi:hypothetical protein
MAYEDIGARIPQGSINFNRMVQEANAKRLAQEQQVVSPQQKAIDDAFNAPPTKNPEAQAEVDAARQRQQAVDDAFNASPTKNPEESQVKDVNSADPNTTNDNNPYAEGNAEQQGGGSLDKAPVYTANNHDPDPNAKADNPNKRLADEAKDPKKAKDPKSEVNKGGNKSHTITNKEIEQLEKQTNLTLYPYIAGGELARIKHQFSNLNQNKYYLLLNMLVYGFDNKILQSGAYGSEKYVIDKAFLNDFLRMAKIPQLQEIIKKTPAYAKKSFDDIGKLGVTEANANNMDNNPITGPTTEHPSLAAAIMNGIHTEAVSHLDAFCNKVRTSAFLSLPKRAFGSIQNLVQGINGVIAAFAKIINDIYCGIMRYVQMFFGYINGFLAKLQQLLMTFLESLIPVDLLCLLAIIMELIGKQTKILTSLMSMSNVMNQATGGLQSYVSQAMGGAGGGLTAFANNPFAAVNRFLPPQVNQIVQQVNSFSNNPQAFLSTAITNYGYATAAKQTQGEVLNIITQKLGSNFSAMSPIASILGASSNPNGSSMPESSSNLGPNLTKNGTENAYGQPMDSSKIKANSAGGAPLNAATEKAIKSAYSSYTATNSKDMPGY